MLDCPGNRSNAFDMQIAKPLFSFSQIKPILVACLGNMANILHLMGDTEC